MGASDDIDTDDFPDRPSRSARKREAEYLQKLGVRLLELKPAQLAALALPEALLDALAEARRLRSRVALSRQRQYIGRLMREVDPAPLEAALENARGGPAGRSPPRGNIPR